MPFHRFAVLDVETTAGDPTKGRIIDVAVIALDGTTERLRWDSLVDPGVPVPPFMSRLTGLRSADLVGAPRFVEIVRTLETLTQDRILVAHNVRYDMTALDHEFARTGLVFSRATLCTERLAHRLMPQLPRYNLGSICRHVGIPFKAAHRALPDAQAAASLLVHMIDRFGMDNVMKGVVPSQRALRA